MKIKTPIRILASMLIGMGLTSASLQANVLLLGDDFEGRTDDTFIGGTAVQAGSLGGVYSAIAGMVYGGEGSTSEYFTINRTDFDARNMTVAFTEADMPVGYETVRFSFSVDSTNLTRVEIGYSSDNQASFSGAQNADRQLSVRIAEIVDNGVWTGDFEVNLRDPVGFIAGGSTTVTGMSGQMIHYSLDYNFTTETIEAFSVNGSIIAENLGLSFTKAITNITMQFQGMGASGNDWEAGTPIVDEWSLTAIPEAGHIGLLTGAAVLGVLVLRRKHIY